MPWKEQGVGGPEFTDSGQTSCLSKPPPAGLQTGGNIHLAGFRQERYAEQVAHVWEIAAPDKS